MTKPIVGVTTFDNLPPPWQTAQLDANFVSVENAVNDMGTYSNPLADTSGSPNAITVPIPSGLTATYVFGLLLYVKVANTTTSGTVTLAVDGLGPQNVFLPGGANLPVGGLVAGGVYPFMHDGTNFEMVGYIPPTGSYLGPITVTTAGSSLAGEVTITAPASGLALLVNGASGTYAAQLNAANASSGQALLLNGQFTGAGNIALLQLSDVNNTNGVNLKLLGNGGTTPSKTIHVTGGVFRVANDAYSADILTLTDAGVLTVATVNGSTALQQGGTLVAQVPLTVSSKSGAYTLAQTDTGSAVPFTATATLTVPTGLTAGSVFVITAGSGVVVTIAQGSGMTLQWANGGSSTGNRTLTGFGQASILINSGGTTALVSGGGLT